MSRHLAPYPRFFWPSFIVLVVALFGGLALSGWLLFEGHPVLALIVVGLVILAANTLPDALGRITRSAIFNQPPALDMSPSAVSARRVEALYATRPDEFAPLAEHGRYLGALGNEMKPEDPGPYPGRSLNFVVPQRLYFIYLDAMKTAQKARDRQGHR